MSHAVTAVLDPSMGPALTGEGAVAARQGGGNRSRKPLKAARRPEKWRAPAEPTSTRFSASALLALRRKRFGRRQQVGDVDDADQTAVHGDDAAQEQFGGLGGDVGRRLDLVLAGGEDVGNAVHQQARDLTAGTRPR